MERMTPRQIEDRINEILQDSRMTSKTATVFSNAPLALIQFGLSTELHTLQKVIGMPLTSISGLRNELK